MPYKNSTSVPVQTSMQLHMSKQFSWDFSVMIISYLLNKTDISLFRLRIVIASTGSKILNRTCNFMMEITVQSSKNEQFCLNFWIPFRASSSEAEIYIQESMSCLCSTGHFPFLRSYHKWKCLVVAVQKRKEEREEEVKMRLEIMPQNGYLVKSENKRIWRKITTII